MRGLAWIDDVDEAQMPSSHYAYAPVVVSDAPPTLAQGRRKLDETRTRRREGGSAADTLRDPHVLSLAEELESHVRRKPRIAARPKQVQAEALAEVPTPSAWQALPEIADASPIVTHGVQTAPSLRARRSSRLRQAVLFVFGMLTGLLIIAMGDPRDALHEGRIRVAAALRALAHPEVASLPVVAALPAALPGMQPVQPAAVRVAPPVMPVAHPSMMAPAPAPPRVAPPSTIPVYDVSQLPLVQSAPRVEPTSDEGMRELAALNALQVQRR